LQNKTMRRRRLQRGERRASNWPSEPGRTTESTSAVVTVVTGVAIVSETFDAAVVVAGAASAYQRMARRCAGRATMALRQMARANIFLIPICERSDQKRAQCAPARREIIGESRAEKIDRSGQSRALGLWAGQAVRAAESSTEIDRLLS